jgi:hypothetical protein
MAGSTTAKGAIELGTGSGLDTSKLLVTDDRPSDRDHLAANQYRLLAAFQRLAELEAPGGLP